MNCLLLQLIQTGVQEEKLLILYWMINLNLVLPFAFKIQLNTSFNMDRPAIKFQVLDIYFL